MHTPLSKKFFNLLCTILITTSCFVNAAETKIVPINTEYEQCKNDAYNFITNIPHSKTLAEVFIGYQKLNTPTQYLVMRYAHIHQLITVHLIACPQDIFRHIIKTITPCYAIPQHVILKPAEYTRYVNGYLESSHIKRQEQPLHSIVTEPTTGKQEKIFTLNPLQAFDIIREYQKQKTYTINDIIQDPSSSKSSLLENMHGYFDFDGSSKIYCWDLDDFINTTSRQRTILDAIAQSNKDGQYNINKRYVMNDESTQSLMPIKKLIDKNDLFRHLNIGIPYESPGRIATIKDRLMLAVPLFIVEGIIPLLIYNNIKGKMQGLAGCAVSYGSGYVIGNWIFPLCDAWTSSALIAYKFFGNNKTVFEKRWSFAMLGLFNFIIHSIAQKFLSIPTLSYQIAGYVVHSFRALFYIMAVLNRYEYYNCFLNLFNEIFKLKQYDHPLNRRNKDDKDYTLIDLLNAQEHKS